MQVLYVLILKNGADNFAGIVPVRIYQYAVHALLCVDTAARHGPPDAPLAVGGGIRVVSPAGVAAPGAKVFCNHRGSFAAGNAGQFNLDSKVLFFMLSYAIFKASLIFSRRSGIIAVPEPRGFGLLEQSELFSGCRAALIFLSAYIIPRCPSGQPPTGSGPVLYSTRPTASVFPRPSVLEAYSSLACRPALFLF